MKPAE